MQTLPAGPRCAGFFNEVSLLSCEGAAKLCGTGRQGVRVMAWVPMRLKMYPLKIMKAVPLKMMEAVPS